MLFFNSTVSSSTDLIKLRFCLDTFHFFLIYTYLELDVNIIKGDENALTDQDKEDIIADVEKINNGDFTEEDEYKYLISSSLKIFLRTLSTLTEGK